MCDENLFLKSIMLYSVSLIKRFTSRYIEAPFPYLSYTHYDILPQNVQIVNQSLTNKLVILFVCCVGTWTSLTNPHRLLWKFQVLNLFYDYREYCYEFSQRLPRWINQLPYSIPPTFEVHRHLYCYSLLYAHLFLAMSTVLSGCAIFRIFMVDNILLFVLKCRK